MCKGLFIADDCFFDPSFCNHKKTDTCVPRHKYQLYSFFSFRRVLYLSFSPRAFYAFRYSLTLEPLRGRNSPRSPGGPVLLYLGEHLVPPLRFPTGKVTHPGEKKNLWPGSVHQPRLSREVFWLLKVVSHLKTLYIISGIAVTVTDGTADDQVHILNLVFDAHRHWNFPSRFLPQPSTAGATLPKSFQA